MKAFGIVGWSGSGKTTLVGRLLPLMAARGLKVSVIKQSHHDFEIDRPGKDSWRHRQAGAAEVLLTSPHRWAVIHELRGAREPSLADHLGRLSPCDLVLVEGFKGAPVAKLEVWRRELGRPWLYPEYPDILAVAADVPPAGIRHLPLDDVATVARFILETLEI
jgi:molybdopterin-guanine dinucleotide biosynthesis adapter protein